MSNLKFIIILKFIITSFHPLHPHDSIKLHIVSQLTAATIDDQLQAKSAQCIDYRIASSIAVQLIAYKIVN